MLTHKFLELINTTLNLYPNKIKNLNNNRCVQNIKRDNEPIFSSILLYFIFFDKKIKTETRDIETNKYKK